MLINVNSKLTSPKQPTTLPGDALFCPIHFLKYFSGDVLHIAYVGYSHPSSVSFLYPTFQNNFKYQMNKNNINIKFYYCANHSFVI